MAADCKSAAPWSYGGSNPPLCTRNWKYVLRGSRAEHQTLNKALDENSELAAGPDKANGFGPRSAGRMWIALALLAALSVLAVKTIDPGKIRTVVLVLLGFFALRIVLSAFASR